ncbi:MAG: MBL fold metallo-hydrolase [Propionibacteriaceae bacterium]|nr:MBL fold metallo-hydrolase [Propionibacteriaceae bacterium]
MVGTTLTFLGGALSVTGSKFLLETDQQRILIDCGLFQGEKKLRLLNWEPLHVDPASIDCVLLTHAHLDHCGYLPRLVRDGFAGPIWATDGTIALAEIVLRDSAHIQESDARDAAQGGYSRHDSPQPLYTTADAETAISLLKFIDFDTDLELPGGVIARFTRAAHILGSASIHVTTPTGDVLFSGDLGRRDHPVLRPRETPPSASVVLIESTYGDREHREWEDCPHEELADAIRRTISRGGRVLIPSFAVDRTEILLKTLAEMKEEDRIPDVPIFVDSPMGVQALRVYQSEEQRDELLTDLQGRDFTHLGDVHEVLTLDESVKLQSSTEPAIIISSSGMATAGRVVHHLERILPSGLNTIVFTGYQAKGTRGHSLITGAKHIKMFGSQVPVRAEVLLDDGFSVHADGSDLIDWLADLSPKPQSVYCVHGEAGAEVLAERIRTELNIDTYVPALGTTIELPHPLFSS